MVLLGEGFGDVDLAQRDQSFVFGVKLRVILIDKINEFLAVNELEVALEVAKSRAFLLKLAAETKRPKSFSDTLPESSDTVASLTSPSPLFTWMMVGGVTPKSSLLAQMSIPRSGPGGLTLVL